MDDIIAITPTILFALIIVLFIIKLALFFNTISNRTINRFLYFRNDSIYNSSTGKSRRAKILQNTFTKAIVVTAILALLIFVLIN